MRLLAAALLACASVPTPALADPPATLRHASVVVDGTRLHYVTAGSGDPVLLLPGWPEDWYAWRDVIPALVASGHTVYALDPRGFGDSDKPATGYDPDSAAKDIHGFIVALDLDRPGGIDVVGHDVGTWIAFYHAARYPQDVRRLVLSEATLPGVSPPASGVPAAGANVKTWQFAFNRLDDLPETLVAGRERAFLVWLFANKSVRRPGIDETALDEYTRSFSAPGAARAGFNYYRAFFSDAGLAEMRAAAARGLPMPALTIGAEGGVGNALSDTVRPLGHDVRGTVIAGCGHYLGDECPAEFARAILDFWKSTEPEKRP